VQVAFVFGGELSLEGLDGEMIQTLKRPHGLNEIVATFGNIIDHVRTDPKGQATLDSSFEKKHIIAVSLPFAIPLAGNNSILVSKIRCHRLLQERMQLAFERIFELDLNDEVRSFGGCFQFRQKRTGRGLSTHSWGIALDLNCETNRPAAKGDMSAGIVSLFEELGFVWGGEWMKDKDPMHFQYCSGY
jgi:hypothetical protein